MTKKEFKYQLLKKLFHNLKTPCYMENENYDLLFVKEEYVRNYIDKLSEKLLNTINIKNLSHFAISFEFDEYKYFAHIFDLYISFYYDNDCLKLTSQHCFIVNKWDLE